MDMRTYMEQTQTRQSDLARRLGVTQGYLSKLMAGRKRPSLALAACIERETGGAVTVSSWLHDGTSVSPEASCLPGEQGTPDATSQCDPST